MKSDQSSNIYGQSHQEGHSLECTIRSNLDKSCLFYFLATFNTIQLTNALSEWPDLTDSVLGVLPFRGDAIDTIADAKQMFVTFRVHNNYRNNLETTNLALNDMYLAIVRRLSLQLVDFAILLKMIMKMQNSFLTMTFMLMTYVLIVLTKPTCMM
ncbi:hypothetical protein MAR_033227 [Mya arenaria]|uniref:Uncharacterized protein n=1 Tax=Mya arenaria TaxID=6604 RepID=A0ABY7G8F0_MYAAR|nr:hypothetical protein MAR_033227 [Mya arenaria]